MVDIRDTSGKPMSSVTPPPLSTPVIRLPRPLYPLQVTWLVNLQLVKGCQPITFKVSASAPDTARAKAKMLYCETYGCAPNNVAILHTYGPFMRVELTDE
jgi:hypothetical protein